jgi:hypothetical protein
VVRDQSARTTHPVEDQQQVQAVGEAEPDDVPAEGRDVVKAEVQPEEELLFTTQVSQQPLFNSSTMATQRIDNN